MAGTKALAAALAAAAVAVAAAVAATGIAPAARAIARAPLKQVALAHPIPPPAMLGVSAAKARAALPREIAHR